MAKTFILIFKDNEDVHTKLKEWCTKNDRSLNGTIIELIKKHLNGQRLKKLETLIKKNY